MSQYTPEKLVAISRYQKYFRLYLQKYRTIHTHG